MDDRVVPWPLSIGWWFVMINHDLSWLIVINLQMLWKSSIIIKGYQKSQNVMKSHHVKRNIFGDLWWSHFHDFWWYFFRNDSTDFMIFYDFWWHFVIFHVSFYERNGWFHFDGFHFWQLIMTNHDFQIPIEGGSVKDNCVGTQFPPSPYSLPSPVKLSLMSLSRWFERSRFESSSM